MGGCARRKAVQYSKVSGSQLVRLWALLQQVALIVEGVEKVHEVANLKAQVRENLAERRDSEQRAVPAHSDRNPKNNSEKSGVEQLCVISRRKRKTTINNAENIFSSLRECILPSSTYQPASVKLRTSFRDAAEHRYELREYTILLQSASQF